MLQIVFVLLSLFKIRSRYLCRLWEIKILPFVNVQNGTSPEARLVKSLPAMQETRIRFMDQEDPLEKEMATYTSILAWRIPWTEEPGKLQSMGL